MRSTERETALGKRSSHDKVIGKASDAFINLPFPTISTSLSKDSLCAPVMYCTLRGAKDKSFLTNMPKQCFSNQCLGPQLPSSLATSRSRFESLNGRFKSPLDQWQLSGRRENRMYLLASCRFPTVIIYLLAIRYVFNYFFFLSVLGSALLGLCILITPEFISPRSCLKPGVMGWCQQPNWLPQMEPVCGSGSCRLMALTITNAGSWRSAAACLLYLH